MKKALHLILALLIAQLTYAQTTLPNLDFENWQQKYYNTLYPDKFYWECLPTDIWASGNAASKSFDKFPTYRTTDAKSGDYAACLETMSIFGQPASGSLFTGWFKADMFNSQAFRGVPFTGKPTAFQGWYKYSPKKYDGVTDTAAIYAILSQWSGSERVEIARAEIYPHENILEYTYFNLPFDYYNDLDPDTIAVVFASSKHGESFKGGIGSKLFIDDVNFDYEPISVGKNVKQDDIKVFYSSSNRILFVKTASLEQIQVELFDINGKKTGFWLVNSNNNSITIDNLSQGVYLCRVVTKDLAPFVTKIFIE
ncbi:MAG: T9SS type A sorting domain-containing protein [Bacteroidales bacterium]|jgi:hypothetical protein|nr:T9SS type A sorting domain-containing protein [Bacteroidales bacterium]